MPILVKFSADWADEFHAEGLALYNQEQVDQLKLLLDEGKLEWYFGTNEGFEEGDLSPGDFTFTEISEEEALFLKRLIPDLERGTFGQIPDPRYLAEIINNTIE